MCAVMDTKFMIICYSSNRKLIHQPKISRPAICPTISTVLHLEQEMCPLLRLAKKHGQASL